MIKLAWLVLTYLVASFPFGLFIAKAFCNIDPRLEGSCNTGSTNVARLCGTRYGVLTLVCDLLKGFLPVCLAGAFSGSWFFLSLAALAAVVGHMYSLFLYGKGGKGVAVTIGAFLALAPITTILASILCLLTIWKSEFVSMGSLVLAVSLPILLLFGGNIGYVPVALIVMILILYKHGDNIARLKKGTEKPWRTAPQA